MRHARCARGHETPLEGSRPAAGSAAAAAPSPSITASCRSMHARTAARCTIRGGHVAEGSRGASGSAPQPADDASASSSAALSTPNSP